MIMQALYQCYQNLQADPASRIPLPGFSQAAVTFAALISREGELLDLVDLSSNNKALGLFVPEQKKRSGTNPPPYFLCEKAQYFFGIAEDMKNGRFPQFRDLHFEILEGLENVKAQAVLLFLEKWDPYKWTDYPFLTDREKDLYRGKNIVFRLEGAKSYVHENAEIIKAWDKFRMAEEEGDIGQCLITGKETKIARIHSVPIKGVAGAQSAGAALVSFNIDAFESYGKKQSYNAPVGEEAAFAYATALNYLLASDKHRIRFSDTTMVFWAEKEIGGIEEDWLVFLLDPPQLETEKLENEKTNRKIDPIINRQIMDVLKRMREGLPIADRVETIDPDVRFYLLGLAPNNARVSVRFWQIDTFGNLLKRIGQHYEDLNIIGLERYNHGLIPIWQILKETAVQGKTENIPPVLGGYVMRSIITGQAYPQNLYNLILSRIRSGGEDAYVNALRAGIIKACLKRRAQILNQREKEEQFTMSLNKESTNTPYRLGRLFALLEKAQQDAVPEAKATITDRYFGSASATPGAVFPILLRLSRHHISKAEYGGYIDSLIQEVMDGLEEFPKHLNLEEQGIFILGYYHQRQAIYQKKEERDN